jgi:hypothetical protein
MKLETVSRLEGAALVAVLFITAAILGACEASPSHAGTNSSRSSMLAPWQPVDEAFRGCEGGCGLRVASSAEGVGLQPGVQVGERTYCPVSGVILPVEEASAHRVDGGARLWFCCETCALYFDANRDRVVAFRGLVPTG